MIYLQTMVSLLFVLGLMIALYAAVQKLGLGLPRKAGGRAIQVVETAPLGEKRSLVLVRVGGRLFLVGATSQSVSLVSTLETDSVPEVEEPVTRPFREVLTPLLQGFRKGGVR